MSFDWTNGSERPLSGAVWSCVALNCLNCVIHIHIQYIYIPNLIPLIFLRNSCALFQLWHIFGFTQGPRTTSTQQEQGLGVVAARAQKTGCCSIGDSCSSGGTENFVRDWCSEASGSGSRPESGVGWVLEAGVGKAADWEPGRSRVSFVVLGPYWSGCSVNVCTPKRFDSRLATADRTGFV